MAEDFILEMLAQATKDSTKLDDDASDNLILKRDKHGNLCSYSKETGEKIGRIYEHGNDEVAKSFNDVYKERSEER